MLERYENLRHEGPDYSYFLQVEMKEKLYDAVQDWLENEAYVVVENIGIFCDVVESIKKDKVVIYACVVNNKDDENLFKGCAMLNAIRVKSLRDMDRALNYLIKFVRLLEEEYIYNYCEAILERMNDSNNGIKTPAIAIAEDDENAIIQEEFEIIPKTLDEIYNITASI